MLGPGIGQIVLPAAFATAGVVQIARAGIRIPRVIAAGRWEEVDGEILSSDIEPDPPHVVTITYRYIVDGSAFVGDQIHPAGIRPTTYEQSSLLFHKYRPGATVTVYYDPRAPGRAALEPEASWPLTVAVGTGLFLLYIAARIAINIGLL
jgi:hypothetical protein